MDVAAVAEDADAVDITDMNVVAGGANATIVADNFDVYAINKL